MFVCSHVCNPSAPGYAASRSNFMAHPAIPVPDFAEQPLYLSAKIASPEEIATFFGCDVSRIEVPEGEARQRMSRIERGLKNSHKAVNFISEIK